MQPHCTATKGREHRVKHLIYFLLQRRRIDRRMRKGLKMDVFPTGFEHGSLRVNVHRCTIAYIIFVLIFYWRWSNWKFCQKHFHQNFFFDHCAKRDDCPYYRNGRRVSLVVHNGQNFQKLCKSCRNIALPCFKFLHACPVSSSEVQQINWTAIILLSVKLIIICWS